MADRRRKAEIFCFSFSFIQTLFKQKKIRDILFFLFIYSNPAFSVAPKLHGFNNFSIWQKKTRVEAVDLLLGVDFWVDFGLKLFLHICAAAVRVGFEFAGPRSESMNILTKTDHCNE